MGLFVTLSINDIQHNSTLHYGECHYAEFRDYFIVMLNVVMLSDVAPYKLKTHETSNFDRFFRACKRILTNLKRLRCTDIKQIDLKHVSCSQT